MGGFFGLGCGGLRRSMGCRALRRYRRRRYRLVGEHIFGRDLAILDRGVHPRQRDEVLQRDVLDAAQLELAEDLLGRDAIGLEGGEQIFRKRSEEHTSELQSHLNLVCRLLLEKKNNTSYLY